MATERKTKTTEKKSSGPKHVRDSKSGKASPTRHARNPKCSPDPGPMRGNE